jgi:hypothetical protein
MPKTFKNKELTAEKIYDVFSYYFASDLFIFQTIEIGVIFWNVYTLKV